VIEAAIYSLLVAAGIANVYPVLLPEQVDYPAVTYQVIDSPPVHSLDEAMGDDPSTELIHPRIQISAWGNDYKSVLLLGQQVKNALHGFSGTVATPEGPVTVNRIHWEDARDLYEERTRTFHRASDFEVWYNPPG
jgi:hypothetical protein